MIEEEKRGGRLINRPRSWEEDLRQKRRRKRLFRQGGYYSPLLIPGGKLAKKMITKKAQNNPCIVEADGPCSKVSVTYTPCCELCGEGASDYRKDSGRNSYTWSRLKHLTYIEQGIYKKSVLFN